MTDAERLHAMETLLDLFWEVSRSLGWSMNKDGHLGFYVECSDTFYWATADGEEITLPDDLDALAQARLDCDEDDWPLLWAVRHRGMRPMNAYMEKILSSDDHAQLRALIEAAAPPRESVFGAP